MQKKTETKIYSGHRIAKPGNTYSRSSDKGKTTEEMKTAHYRTLTYTHNIHIHTYIDIRMHVLHYHYIRNENINNTHGR